MHNRRIRTWAIGAMAVAIGIFCLLGSPSDSSTDRGGATADAGSKAVRSMDVPRADWVNPVLRSARPAADTARWRESGRRPAADARTFNHKHKSVGWRADDLMRFDSYSSAEEWTGIDAKNWVASKWRNRR